MTLLYSISYIILLLYIILHIIIHIQLHYAKIQTNTEHDWLLRKLAAPYTIYYFNIINHSKLLHTYFKTPA